jgi:uracil permease
MTDSRNLTIMAGTLCVGIGIGALNDGVIPIVFSQNFKLSLSGLFVATIVGVLMNLLIPKKHKEENK